MRIQVLFIPKAPTKYGATIEFSAKLPHEDSPLPLMTMELKGEGRYPQLLFDRPVAFLPAVPVGFTSQTQFMIHNDGCVQVMCSTLLLCLCIGLHDIINMLIAWLQV